MAYVIVRPADHQGWLAERKKGIGSSEAGTIMGVNKFDTPYRLWRRKREIDPPVQTNEAMELGHHLEFLLISKSPEGLGYGTFRNST